MINYIKDLPSNLSIVGNAQSLFEKSYGRLIDENPTVRFNRTEIIQEKSQGSRWDFLVSSEVNTFEKYNHINPPFHTLIFSPTKSEMVSKIKKVKFKTKIFHLPIYQSDELIRILGVSPSTGLQILYYLNSIHHPNVSIFGFDFKKTNTFYEIRNKGNHRFDLEKEIILNLVNTNNWKFYE